MAFQHVVPWVKLRSSDLMVCCVITLLYGVNMFYSHWLIKLLNWLISRHNTARWEIQTEIQEKEKGAIKRHRPDWVSESKMGMPY